MKSFRITTFFCIFLLGIFTCLALTLNDLNNENIKLGKYVETLTNSQYELIAKIDDVIKINEELKFYNEGLKLEVNSQKVNYEQAVKVFREKLDECNAIETIDKEMIKTLKEEVNRLENLIAENEIQISDLNLTIETLNSTIESLQAEVQKYVDFLNSDNPAYKFIQDGALTSLPEMYFTNVTSIRPYAFYNCINLTKVELPNTIKTVGSYAFSYSKKLEKITFSNTLEKIDSNAFSNCETLKNIILPSSLKTIGIQAFSNCNFLGNVILNEGLEILGENVFSNSYVTNLIVPSTITNFGKYCFSIYYLENITLPNNFNYDLNLLGLNNCLKLTVSSLNDVVLKLKDRSEETMKYTLNIGTYNLSKLSEEQKSMITLKGWLYS